MTRPLPTTAPGARSRSRRTGSLLAVGVLTALALAACGSDDAGSTESTAGAPTGAVTATSAPAITTPAAAGTRTVDTPHGSIEVSAAPQRIVSVQASTSSILFDLGVAPVGIYDEGEEYVATRYLDQWKAADKVGTAGEFDLEAISALRPDLIIGIDYAFIGDVYEQLSKIAPTVLVATEGSWRTQAADIASVVGAVDALQHLSEAYDARTEEISTTYADELASSTWDFVQGGFDAGNYWIYGPTSDVVDIAVAAGVQLAPASAQTTDANRSVSYEEAGLLEGADMIAFYAGVDGSPQNDLDLLFANPIFEGLPAVTAGHLLPMPDFLPGSYGDAMGVLDTIETGLQQL